MRTTQMHRGRSLKGVQGYLDGNAAVVGAVNSSDARTQLDTSVSTFDAAVEEEGARTRDVRGEVNRRRQLERRVVRKFMTPLAKYARSQLRGVPDFAALTPSANDLRADKLVASARAMITAAAPHAARIAAHFSAGFLEQFGAAVDEVSASFTATTDKRRQRKGATKLLDAALRDGRSAVAAIDSVVSHLILGNARLEEEWRVAKRIAKSTGVRHEKPAATSAPAPAQEVKSA
jgi:hypothetical protein